MKKTLIILLITTLSILNAANINLEDAEKKAIDQNYEILVKQHELKSEELKTIKAYSSLLPSITANAGYSKPDDPIAVPMTNFTQESSKSYGYSIVQPIFMGGKISLGILMQKDSYKMKKNELEQKKIEIIKTVRNKYYAVLESKNLYELSKKNLTIAINNEAEAKIKFENGISSKADYLRFQSVRSQKEVDLIQTENLHLISIEDLKNYLNVSEDIEVQDIDFEQDSKMVEAIVELSVSKIDIIVKKLSNLGETKNKNLKNMKTSIDISKKSSLMAISSMLPSISLQYQKNWSKPDYLDEYSDSGTLMLNASIPIFPLIDNGSEILTSKHSIQSMKYNYASFQDNINLNIKRTFYSLIASAKSLKSSKLTKEYSEESYQQMKIRFDNDIITATDLLSSEVAWRNSENQYVSAKYNYLNIKTQLLELLSTTDETVLNKLIRR